MKRISIFIIAAILTVMSVNTVITATETDIIETNESVESVTVSFGQGHENANGSMDNVTVQKGTEYVLPKCVFTVPGMSFNGWFSGVDGKIYNAGDKCTVNKNVSFTATYKETPKEQYTISFGGKASDITIIAGKSFELPAYETAENEIFYGWKQQFTDGTLSEKIYGVGKYPDTVSGNMTFIADTAVYNDFAVIADANGEKTVFDGFDAVKHTVSTDENGNILPIVAEYTAENAMDISVYRYLTVMYSIDGTVAAEEKPYFTVTTDTDKTVNQEISPEKGWNFTCIDLSELVNDGNDGRINSLKLSLENGTYNTFYVGRLIFSKDKLSAKDKLHNSYMKGYEGYEGREFKPDEKMTRAQACVIVARYKAGFDVIPTTDGNGTPIVSPFDDVRPQGENAHWAHNEIAYVASLGYLNGYKGEFLPDQAITRAEFVKLVVNMTYNDGDNKDLPDPGFSDVKPEISRSTYTAVAIAVRKGFINGYKEDNTFRPEGEITRAEVVTVFNRSIGRDTAVITPIYDRSVEAYNFVDVRGHWAEKHILEATVPHLELIGEAMTDSRYSVMIAKINAQ
ncbi:MAG: hypothetical protein E7583_07915 [Ruminococcaceae bacterium]|nr:hypothetical protein [Oscillospiraceae bacterium]